MPEARGRLRNGSRGVLTFSDGVVTLWEERGRITKRRVKVAEFFAAEATSAQLGGGEDRFKGMHRLVVGYAGEGPGAGEEAATFLSQDLGSMETIKGEIDREIERRRAALESEMRERRRAREAHVRHLTLLLELLDSAFQIVLELDGGVDWGLIGRYRSEVERIGMELGKLDGVEPIDIDVGGLSASIKRRTADDIKRECYSLIEVVYKGSEEIAHRDERSGAFSLELYLSFVRSYLLLWDLRLGEHLDSELQRDELEELEGILKELGAAAEPKADLRLGEIEEPTSPSEAALRFSSLRSMIYQRLNRLVD